MLKNFPIPIHIEMYGNKTHRYTNEVLKMRFLFCSSLVLSSSMSNCLPLSFILQHKYQSTTTEDTYKGDVESRAPPDIVDQ